MQQLRTVAPYFRPYRRILAWGLALVVVANAFTLASPYALKLAIDGLAGEDGSVAPNAARNAGLYALLIVAMALAGGAARYGMREIMNGVSRRIEVDLRNDFFRHLLRLDAGFYGRTRTGDLMSRATNDTLAVRQAAGPAVMYSANTIVNFAFGLALMAFIDLGLTLAVMAPLALLPPAVVWFGRAIHRRFEDIQEHFGAMSTMVQENMSGVRIVRAYGQERGQEREFDALNREYLRRNMRLAYAAGGFHPALGFLSGCATVALLWHGGGQVVAGAITVGDFVAFFWLLAMLAWPMITLGWVVNIFQRGAASMGRLNRVFAVEPRIAAPPAPRPPPPGPAEIAFRSVTFRYPGAPEPALKDVSFAAPPGCTVAVVGPTGSGKSTLVALVARVWDPTAGAVLLDGRPLRDYDPADVRARVGFAPQDTLLFSDLLGRNIALGLPEAEPGPEPPREDRRQARVGLARADKRRAPVKPTNENERQARIEQARKDRRRARVKPTNENERQGRVEQASAAAHLHDAVREFPRGYDTMLGERGINLSGGQKQRATLARALAIDPDVLVLDDVLSAVDTETESRILRGLEDQLRGRTAFVISHRVTAVRDADLILVMEEGRIVERGRHDELLAFGGAYASLLRRQLLEEDLSMAGAA